MNHKPGYVVVIITAVLTSLVTVYMRLLSIGLVKTPDIFPTVNQTKYHLDIYSQHWMFLVWSGLYLWQIAWLVYGLTTLCRSTTYGYLYAVPAHIPPVVYILFSVSNACSVGWLFTWAHSFPQYSLLLIVLNTLTLCLLFYFACYQLHSCASILQDELLDKDLWITRVLLLNGAAGYIAWSTVMMLFNLAVVLCNANTLTQTTANTLALVVILIFVIFWFFLENWKLDSSCRYTPLPYIAVIFILSGTIAHFWDPSKPNCILSVCILATVVLLTAIKLTLLVIRHRRNPIVYSDTYTSSHQSHIRSYGSMSRSDSTSRMPESIIAGQ